MGESANFARSVLNVIVHLVDAEAEPISGSVEFVRRLQLQGIVPALASASPRILVEQELRVLGLSDCFVPIVTGEDVEQGKPDPAIYLKAAALMDIDPQMCVVIEDSPAGVVSALAAGTACVMLTSSSSPSLPWSESLKCLALVSDLRLLNLKTLID